MKNTLPQPFLILVIISFSIFPELVSAQSFNLPNLPPPPVHQYYFPNTAGKRKKDKDENIVSRRNNFTIVLNNDSVLERKAMIDVYKEVHQLKENYESEEFIVKPSDTKEIYRTTIDGRKIVGKPFDNCWIFMVDSTNIRTYSYTSEGDNAPIAYIQKDEHSEILPLNVGNLEEMIQDDKKVLALLHKGKLMKALRAYINK